MKDEILEELWKVKDQIASEAKGNAQALLARLRAVEQQSGHRIVNRTNLVEQLDVDARGAF